MNVYLDWDERQLILELLQERAEALLSGEISGTGDDEDQRERANALIHRLES